MIDKCCQETYHNGLADETQNLTKWLLK